MCRQNEIHVISDRLGGGGGGGGRVAAVHVLWLQCSCRSGIAMAKLRKKILNLKPKK